MVKVQQKFFKTAGGVNTDQGLSLTANCKNVFVSGFISGPTACDFSGRLIQTKNNGATDDQDAFVAGLDHNGCQIFFKTAGATSTDDTQATSITSNCHGAFVTGLIEANSLVVKDFDGTNVPTLVNAGVFVAGFDNCGHQKFFVTAGEALITPQKIAQNNKRIFVTSGLDGPDVFDFKGEAHTISSNENVLVAGLDHHGKQKFFKTAGGSSGQLPNDIAADECNVYVTGLIGTPTATDFNGASVVGYGNIDAFVAGLSNCGTQRFYKHAGLLSTSSQGNAISASCGNAFVTGFIGAGVSGVATDFDGKAVVQTYGNGDIFAAGLTECGKQKFFKVAGGISSDSGLSIADNENGVFITGFIRGPTAVDFNGRSVDVYGNNDIFVAGLSRCGKQLFFKTAGSSGNDQGNSITVDNSGVFVTGVISGGTATDFNGCPIQNLQGGGDIFVAKLDFCGHQQFFVTAGGAEDDAGSQIVVRDNEIFVTGFVEGKTGTDFRHHDIKRLKGDRDIFVARLDDLCAKYRSKFSSMPYVPR